MSARSHTPRDPAKPGSIEVQLPWWAIALPAIAFASLLLLILNPVDAHAATSEPVITNLLERIQAMILRTT
ncbi:hypothetical protein [Streptomyces sp. KL118A]|uniref:hypothetical protein n=1 Tax=Streptomyces sp. KL118A TaxID=3045153 RepID=UPI00278C273F|nr:hypothetical protein [Streptomyces sp. KL118A]